MLEAMVELKIGERSFALKPTFRVLSRIEKALGRSIPKLIMDGVYGENARGLFQDELAAIISIAVEGIGEKISQEAIEDFIMRERVSATVLVADFLRISSSAFPTNTADDVKSLLNVADRSIALRIALSKTSPWIDLNVRRIDPASRIFSPSKSVIFSSRSANFPKFSALTPAASPVALMTAASLICDCCAELVSSTIFFMDSIPTKAAK